MTMYELNFSLLVEQMFSKIVEPTYRQVVVEVSTCTLRCVHCHHGKEYTWQMEVSTCDHVYCHYGKGCT